MQETIGRSSQADRLLRLMLEVSSGDKRAFSELYRATRHKMRKTAVAAHPACIDVEDLLQDAYLKIWRNAQRFDPARSSPISWMAAIVRNTAIDVARSKRPHTVELEEAITIAAPANEPSDEFDYARIEPIVFEAINRLSEDRRTLLSLAYLEGHSRRALSERLGVPVGTVKTWLHRTLRAVKADCRIEAEPATANS